MLFYRKPISILSACVLLTVMSFTLSNSDLKISYKYHAFIGCSNYTDSVMLDRNTFNELISKSFCAKDSNQAILPVTSFEITYAERGLYQDSTGLPIIFTDYSSTKCVGDALPKNWIDIFNERTYKGDTIYFDHIMTKSQDNKSHLCKPIKVVIK
jgi:hypothetical protein